MAPRLKLLLLLSPNQINKQNKGSGTTKAVKDHSKTILLGYHLRQYKHAFKYTFNSKILAKTSKRVVTLRLPFRNLKKKKLEEISLQA